MILADVDIRKATRALYASPEGPLSPFKFWCPGCGADADAPDKEFELEAFILVPDADFLLSEVHCQTCGAHADIAVWLLNKAEFLSEPEFVHAMNEATGPDSVGLLDRYLKQVEFHRRRWDELYAMDEELPGVDLSSTVIELTVSERQMPAVPMQVLATARGLRRSVEAHPLENPAGMLRIGKFNLLASIEEQERAQAQGHPWVLHISVNNTSNPGEFSRAEQFWLPSLFFTPEELADVRRVSGVQAPVIHYFLGMWPQPD